MDLRNTNKNVQNQSNVHKRDWKQKLWHNEMNAFLHGGRTYVLHLPFHHLLHFKGHLSSIYLEWLASLQGRTFVLHVFCMTSSPWRQTCGLQPYCMAFSSLMYTYEGLRESQVPQKTNTLFFILFHAPLFPLIIW